MNQCPKKIISIMFSFNLFKGRLAGWGLTTSGGSPSEILKFVELPVIGRSQCISESDIRYRPYITADKFCAGYLDSNVSACQGEIMIDHFNVFVFTNFLIIRNKFTFR